MSVLDLKLLRDLRRLWAQVLAIALVMAAGVATLVLGVGVYLSLSETRATYYERNRFADVFATVTRAPDALAERIGQIPGVSAVETRISRAALLDIPEMVEPATGQLVSLPDHGAQRLNVVHLRLGRLPQPDHPDEVVLNEPFANAHGYRPGSTFGALINGKRRTLTVVGIGLSPEFIYSIGPGFIVPDSRRFGVMWMSRRALGAAFDMNGAFTDVAVKLTGSAKQEDVIDRIDLLLERYGSRGAYGRKDQFSHAFLEAELMQLDAMSRVLPPIFLLVAAFLVNITLTRLVSLEREQIGLMKALGYSNAGVAWHYMKFVAGIAVLGVVIGGAFGTWLGRMLTVIYGEFYYFPFLIFDTNPVVYATATAATLGAVLLGAARAVWGVVGLAPSVAMRPPAPTVYRRILPRLPVLPRLSPIATMIGRNIVRWPVRALFTTVGIAFSVAMMITSTFFLDSIEEMVDLSFVRSDRQDATLEFTQKLPDRAIHEVRRLPGVIETEPVRALPAIIRHGHLERRVGISGRPAAASLSRVIDLEGGAVSLPETGIALSDALASRLNARVGDIVELEPSEGAERRIMVPVTAIVQGYIGLASYMAIDELNRLMREGPMVTGVNVLLDMNRLDALFAAVKERPMIASVALQYAALRSFRETLEENLTTSLFIYIGFALVIAFGVVYNSARIQLSERGRELASLRVMGFTRAEASWILLGELALLTAFAQPLGWLIGYGLAVASVVGFETDIFRIPLVIGRDIYGWASIVVIVAAVVSALIVRRRIDRLDLIQVLKTRE